MNNKFENLGINPNYLSLMFTVERIYQSFIIKRQARVWGSQPKFDKGHPNLSSRFYLSFRILYPLFEASKNTGPFYLMFDLEVLIHN